MFHGTRTLLLQDDDGQILPTHSVSAGLDYQAIGPEHAMLRDGGRVEYTFCEDDKALDALELLCRTEGILPALESAHAVAYVSVLAPRLTPSQVVIVNLSGRGDKDMETVLQARAGLS